jgi:ribosome maturation factor RimP
MKGTLAVADDEGIVLTGDGLEEEGTRIAYSEIERARTIFEWGPALRRGVKT